MKQLFEKYEKNIDEVCGLYQVLYNSLMYCYYMNTDEESFCNSYLLDIIKEKIESSRTVYEDLTYEYFDLHEREDFEKKLEDGSYYKQNE